MATRMAVAAHWGLAGWGVDQAHRRPDCGAECLGRQDPILGVAQTQRHQAALIGVAGAVAEICANDMHPDDIDMFEPSETDMAAIGVALDDRGVRRGLGCIRSLEPQ
jgi:hypothetical protein